MFKFVFAICLAVMVSMAAAQAPCVGCPAPVDAERLKTIESELKISLGKIAAGEGPAYEIVKVHSATSQVVAGSIYKINADIKDSTGTIKTCDIEMLVPLREPIRLTFECPGDDKVERSHAQ